jgi:predicted ATPase/DNA-binding SARP family transcriptional activator
MHYRVLGPLVPTIASGQQRLLLCCLLVEANRFVAAGRLVEELWGEALPGDPAAALRTQVSRLRQRLPAGALVTEPGGYRLVVGPDDLDSAVFERLVRDGQHEAALALWRGRAFEEFADRPFAQVEAARLEQLRLQAEERRARLLLEQGDAAAAASVAEAVLAVHPERESMRAVLMEALYRSGRQGAALDTYRSWRRDLVDGYGLEPAPALAQLQQSILRHRMPLAAVTRPADSFLGRDREVADIRGVLPTARLVTLTGPGGVGKTRLAVEVAVEAADGFPDGVTVCNLASVERPDAVARAVAWTLGLADISGGRGEDELIAHVAGRRILLLLDGCERVLDAAAGIASALISRSAGITVLATSRERLAVPGEHVRLVAPLPAGASNRLFRDRARAVNSGSPVTDEQVADVCARLDGLPLAIELAAARVGTLRMEQMAAALDDRFGVLADRHRSLAATLQWSFDLLSEVERDGLCLLSAFAGDFDRQAAADLGVDTGVLLRLAERSLVDGANPYRLLDSVRDYARDRLREQNRLDAVTQRHAEWVLQLAVDAAAHQSTDAEQQWAQRLDLHFAELRAAHHWLLAHDTDRAIGLVAALRTWALWQGRTEVFDWADAVASITADPTAVAVCATGAWQRGDLEAAARLAREALPHRWAIEALAEVAFLSGNLLEAQRHHREAADLARAVGDGLQEIWCAGSIILATVYAGDDPGDQPHELLARAAALGSPSARAMGHFVIGESSRSTASLREAITLADGAGSDFIAGLARAALASVSSSRDPVLALEQYGAVIEQWRDAGAWPAYWVTLRTLMMLLTDLGAIEEAATLHGANQAATHGAAAFGRDAALLRTAATRLRDQLGSDAFTALQAEGAALSEDDSARYALTAISRVLDRVSRAASDAD